MTDDPAATVSPARRLWPAGKSRMAALIRAHDWRSTPLGPVQSWPANLRTIVDLMLSSGFPMAVLWGADLIQIYNDAYAALIGRKHPGGLGQPARDVWSEVWSIVGPLHERALAGETLTFENILYPLSRAGRYKDVRCTLSFGPLRAAPDAEHPEGSVAGVLVTIAETIEAGEDAARGKRDDDAPFRQLVETWAQAVWETDASGVVAKDSPSWRAYTGQSLEEWLGQGWAKAVHPADRAEAAARWEATVKAQQPLDAEYRLRHAADGWRWTNVRAAPVRNANGVVTKWIGMNIDIQARKETEAALRESEERLREFAEASSDVLWIRDAATLRFEYVSRAFETVYGGSPDRMVGRDDLRGWLALILPGDRKAVLDAIRRVRRGENAACEFRIRRPSDHELCWIRTTGFPLRDEHGRVRRIAGIFHDVTGQKRAEAALRELNEKLEQRVKERTEELMAAEATLRQAHKMEALGQLTSGIAHDFNNMLQGISNSLELLRRRAQQGRLAEAARYVETAREVVRRAAALTHRLLAFSRQQKLEPSLVNLDELVVGMTEMIQRTVGPGIQVEVRLNNGGPPVLCDASQLENALLNLCLNARDAMPNGGWLTILTEEVQLTEADLQGEAGVAPGPYGTVSVTDTGTGMPAEVVSRAFEPFYTTKPQGQGTGLGLSQVYGFVRQSGGLVRIESTPGKGTTVRLFLPHQRIPADVPEAESVSSPVVLLVEHEESLRRMQAEWLRDAGYRVLEAADGAAALRLLHGGGRVDILVADVGLPGALNGRQLAEMARAERPALPVLFTTGYDGSNLGPLPARTAVIGKPFELDDLLARVEALLAVGDH